MVLIREVAYQALKIGYLTVEAENQLRQLLAKNYDLEDLDAFMTLQQAVMCGGVKKESKELGELVRLWREGYGEFSVWRPPQKIIAD